MRITVLCGGPSSEREISLISGKAVASALREVGHEVFVSDIAPDHLEGLDHPADVIFPVLHGDFGESGELQEILEARDLPFVGSGSNASRLGMDKDAAKALWKNAGLPVPAGRVLDSVPENASEFGLPVVIKAVRSGSSIDVFICKTEAEVIAASSDLIARQGTALMEQFIAGTEITIGLLENRALPPIRIETNREFFDYQSKYTKGGATHSFDLGLSDAVVRRCRDIAERASKILGCRDLGRVDIIVDASNEPYLLEINTIPGFTAVSLLPEAAQKAGISFPQLVDRLANIALERANAAQPAS